MSEGSVARTAIKTGAAQARHRYFIVATRERYVVDKTGRLGAAWGRPEVAQKDVPLRSFSDTSLPPLLLLRLPPTSRTIAPSASFAAAAAMSRKGPRDE